MKDRKLFKNIKLEKKRQKKHIELIASENFVSKQVLKAQGSILTNKYAEGYPGKRYYGGTDEVDKIELLAIDRAKKLFNVKYVNVQPHSGSQANQAAYMALLKPGDKIMGLSLNSGGHLTHGFGVNASGKFYKAVNYDVDENGLLNYDEILKMAKKEKPQIIVCGYSAYSRKINFKKFREIADAVGAYLMADIAHIAGLVITKNHPSPVKYADVITTTTHKTLRSGRGGMIMTNNEAIAKKINSAVFPGLQGGPLLHAIAGKAAGFYEALQPSFKTYIDNVVKNSKAFSDTFKKLGVKVVSNGTDNHLFIIDVFHSFGITGKQAQLELEKHNITTNKNTIPNDTKSPFVTSGIRLGTAAMTTKGYTEKDFENLAKTMYNILDANFEGDK